MGWPRLGIDIAVEGDEKGSNDSQGESNLSQRIDRERVAHESANLTFGSAVFAVGSAVSVLIVPRGVKRGRDNNGPRDEQLHDEEKLGQHFVAVGEVLSNIEFVPRPS